MENEKQLKESYNTAKEKFSLYINTVYGVLENKTRITLSKREEAKREWQNAIKEYNKLVSSAAKQEKILKNKFTH